MRTKLQYQYFHNYQSKKISRILTISPRSIYHKRLLAEEVQESLQLWKKILSSNLLRKIFLKKELLSMPGLQLPLLKSPQEILAELRRITTWWWSLLQGRILAKEYIIKALLLLIPLDLEFLILNRKEINQKIIQRNGRKQNLLLNHHILKSQFRNSLKLT